MNITSKGIAGVVTSVLACGIWGAGVSGPTTSQQAYAASSSWGVPNIADLVERVDAAVVNIDTIARPIRDPFLDMFINEGITMPEQKGVGSGFVIDPNGLIVTNFHVIRQADIIRVTLANGTQYRGRVLGVDPTTDLALIKVNAKGLKSLKFIQGESPRVGEWVVAIGSPLGLSHTVSAGIISATNRGIALNDRVNFIQTDAAINPGNSGGPLLNMAGEVVGVNTAVAARGQGIGFAIPAATARQVVEQLRRNGRVERAWLGVSVRDFVTQKLTGVLIVATAEGGPAQLAGIEPGDVVVSVDQKPVRSARDLLAYLNMKPVGTVVKILVLREGQRLAIEIELQAAPNAAVRR
ncbi:MAG: trypsin-like peptidase domain-containing protein [Candidatus Sericytochromatia bacterium]|nr:trypsin-like peptidase domain-containing protein [Candidatus Sericytochromatia bacterium]